VVGRSARGPVPAPPSVEAGHGPRHKGRTSSTSSTTNTKSSCDVLRVVVVVVVVSVRRTQFINNKYKDLMFFDWHQLRGNQIALNEVTTLLLLSCALVALLYTVYY